MSRKTRKNSRRRSRTIEAAGPKLPGFVTGGCVPLAADCIQAAADDGKGLPRFSMVAYTGAQMVVGGFPRPVVVDLAGLDISRQRIPTRLDHKPNQGVGHTSRVAVEGGQLIAEGVISRDTSWARDVARSGTNGFPWQASIGAAVIDAEFVPAGRRVEVNGRTFEGPVYVARRAILKEISFVDNGADGNTSASIAAKENTDMNFTEWLQAQGFQAEDYTDKQLALLEAAYKAELAAAESEQGGENDAEDGSASDDADDDAAEGAGSAEQGGQVNAAAVQAQIQAAREAVAGESRRVEAIRRVCGGRHGEIEARAISEGWDASKAELHVLRASRPAAPAVHIPRDVSTPRVFEAAALMNYGLATDRLEASFNERTLDAASRIRGAGIQEFCELACGLQLPRYRRDPQAWLQAAFSTTALPGILSNVANKMLLEGYTYVEDAWRKIVKIASVNDFKEHTRYRMNGAFKFEPVGPDGELKHGQLGEQSFKQKIATSGIMFALTREMIINDDLGAFADIPFQVGLGAGEAICDAVWTLLLGNPTLAADGKAFFHADHKNYLEGADTALSIDGLTKAEVQFSLQTKPNGRPLGVPARKLVVPTALKVAAEQLMTALMVNETTTANKARPANNPHAGKFEVVSSSYMQNASFAGNSAAAWYLFADPTRLAALEVAFLSGKDSPTVERAEADFNTLGVQFRGFIDFGVKEQDYRGALKMKGEA